MDFLFLFVFAFLALSLPADATNIGDFVAAGLGLDVSPSSSIISLSTTTLHWRNTTVQTRPSAQTTASASQSSKSSKSPQSSQSNSTHASITQSASLSYGPIDDCWNQWNAWWKTGQHRVDVHDKYCTSTAPALLMAGETGIYETDLYSFTTITSTIAHLITGPGGIVPVATIFLPSTWTTSIATESEEIPTTTYPSWTMGASETIYSCGTYMREFQPVTEPSCALPTVSSQCEDTWSSWISDYIHYDADFSCRDSDPQCNPAKSFESVRSSINGPNCGVNTDIVTTPVGMENEKCRSFIESAIGAEGTWGIPSLNAWETEGSTWRPGDPVKWGSTKNMGAHYHKPIWCTVGCANCAVTADAVRLLYWPQTTTGDPDTLGSASEVVAYVDGVTLTSPTIYLSYRSIYASNSCTNVGPIYSNTIIPLRKNNELSSLVYHPLPGPLGWNPLDGHSGQPQWNFETRSFNLSDLQLPVPRSIYERLPYCAEASRIASMGLLTQPISCSTNIPYAPHIAMPPEIQRLDPAWASCGIYYGGIYDPPSTLQGATVAATVTQPQPVPTTPASPSSTTRLPAETGAGIFTAVQLAVSASSVNAQPAATSVIASPIFSFDPLSSTQQNSSSSSTTKESSIIQAVVIVADRSSPTLSPTNALQILTAAAATQSHRNSNVPASSIVLTAGQEISLGSLAVQIQSSALVVDGTTRSFSSLDKPTQVTAILKAGSETITAVRPAQETGSLNVIVGSSTIQIRPNDTTIVGGKTIAAAPSGNGIILGTQSIGFASTAHQQSGVVFTAAGQTYTAIEPDQTSISLPPVVFPSQALKQNITIGGAIIGVNSASQYIYLSQGSNTAAAPITLSGTTYSLASSGNAIVVNGQTTCIDTGAEQSTSTLGSTLATGDPRMTIAAQSTSARTSQSTSQVINAAMPNFNPRSSSIALLLAMTTLVLIL